MKAFRMVSSVSVPATEAVSPGRPPPCVLSLTTRGLQLPPQGAVLRVPRVPRARAGANAWGRGGQRPQGPRASPLWEGA